MEFTVTSETFREELTKAILFIAERKDDFILKCLHISSVVGDEAKVRLRAFNRVIFYKSDITDVSVTEEGSCYIDGFLLYNIFQTIPGKMDVTLSLEKNQLVIKSADERIKYNLGITTKGEITPPKIGKLTKWKVDRAKVAGALAKCVSAVSMDAFQRVFQGINFYCQDGKLFTVATNTKILVHGCLGETNAKAGSYTIPGVKLSLLSKILEEGDKFTMGVNVLENRARQVYFKIDNHMAIASLMAGVSYPNVIERLEAKIGGATPQVIELHKGAMVRAIKGTMLLEDDKIVKLVVSGEDMVVKSRKEERGDALRLVKIHGGDLWKEEVNLVGENFLKLLEVVFEECEMISITYYGKELPLKVESGESEFLTYIVPIIV